MKISLLLSFCFFLNNEVCRAQKLDYQWLFGNDKLVGLTHLDFNKFPVKVSKILQPALVFDLTNAAISTDEGHLLFYTNGLLISDSTHHIMENGDSLNPGIIADAFNGYGYPLAQGALILPKPDNDSLYYLFHAGREVAFGLNYYYSLINRKGNEGKGKVIDKNHLIINDTIDAGKLSAYRHANGRDWWLLMQDFDRYCYYRLLLTPDTMINLGLQCLEPVEGYGSPPAGQSTFSPDGTHYARHEIRGFPAGHFVRLYDFDRCTGLLSNQIHLPLLDTAGVGGVAFSPDSRFLYVTSQELVYQYDMTATDVASTQAIVAETDGFIDTLDDGSPWFPLTFDGAQLGPDGRIYIHVAGSSRYLHYIAYPNRQSAACEVRQHAIHLPTWTYRTIPNFPHYRTGPLDGSPCDTLGLDNHSLAGFTWEVTDSSQPLSVLFNDNSFYEPTDWLWDFGDGNASNEMNPVHEYAGAGTYSVCLTVSNEYDSDTFCREVTVELPSAAGEEEKKEQVKVFPNPAHSKVFFSFPERMSGQLYLMDGFGRIAVKHEFNDTDFIEMETAALSSGIYFYKIQRENGKNSAGKLIILK